MFVSGWVGWGVVLLGMGTAPLVGVAQGTMMSPAAVPGAASANAVEGSAARAKLEVAAGSGREVSAGFKPVIATVSPAQTLQQQIAALPALTKLGVAADVDVDRRGQEILAHLNAMLRYYRGVVAAPLQKVGEPSDVLYSEQAVTQATDAARTAFQSARNEAALLLKLKQGSKASGTPAPGDHSAAANGEAAPPQTEAQRLAEARARVQARLNDLTAQDTALDQTLPTAKPKDLPALRQQAEQLDGQLLLQKAILDALDKVSALAVAQGGSGLLGDIDRLQRSAPELLSTALRPVVPSLPQNLSAERESGVSSQATVLFQLLSTRHAIDNRIEEVDALQQQAQALRTPMVKVLRGTIAAGDAAMQAAPDPTAAGADVVTATRRHYDQLTATFKVLSTATLPLSQEIVLLEGSRANLLAWRTAVDVEYKSVMRSLLLRVLAIALTLGLLAVVSNVWQRMTVKYVKDLRRRRQLIVVRRLVVGFVTGVVLIFGFVTQFNSLATFAGFITAGIAVGLQTILLSVAAYFFIVGRFGVRVGDRITVAGVTGDVVDVGLVRFYMRELTGTGTELHTTGRVAVFANSVLFQAGTPLYKQMPGTEYAWHELTIKLKPETDYKPATAAVLQAVTQVYEAYQARIEGQHQTVENWMDTAVEKPGIEPRLQLTEGGLQYAVLYPVEIKDAAQTDEKIVHQLLSDMSADGPVKDAIAGPPVVKAVIKG